MIDVARLQPAGLARQFPGRRGDTVGPEPVDNGAVAGLPQAFAKREGGAHEEPIIKLVEVPFVEEELVERTEAGREPRWDLGDQRIADVGDRDAEQSGDQR